MIFEKRKNAVHDLLMLRQIDNFPNISLAWDGLVLGRKNYMKL